MSVVEWLSRQSVAHAICAALLCLVRSEPAHAQSDTDRRLAWSEQWPRFRTWEYVATGVLVGAGLVLEYGTEQPAQARWIGPIVGDQSARGVFRAETRRARDVTAVASDYSWVLSQWYGQVVDVIVVSYLLDDFNLDVAWQLSMLNAEAMSVGFLLTRGSHRLFARARPLREGCDNDSADAELCPFRGTHASFLSGHTSMAFVGAGLTCAHHQYLPIYGSRAADAVACGANIALAGVTGTLRLIADRHWLSDVLIGAVVGFGVGYGMPVLLHYAYGSSEGFGRSSAPLASAGISPNVLRWAGEF